METGTTLHEVRNRHPTPANYSKVRDFGNFSSLLEKRRTKIGFYFFTYECCRKRLPLIKIVNEGLEV